MGMAEYIEREKLISDIDAAMENAGMGYVIGQTMKRYIKRVPAADVSPVRHGRWVEKEKYTFGIIYDCSLCENRILDTGHRWNYCPNCGAKMDGTERS